MLGRAVATLAGVVGIMMVAGAGVASAAPGDPVSSFGTDGSVVNAFGSATPPRSTGNSVAIAPNGDIYEAGSATVASGASELYLARYLPDGQLDASFGSSGVVYENVGDGSSPWTAQNSGGLFMPIGGAAFVRVASNGDPVVLTSASATVSGTDQLAVLEFTPSGDLDSTFGSGGVYKDNISTSTFPGGLALQHNGDIVVTGGAQDSSYQDQFFALRLTPAGVLDSSFGTSGIEELQLGLGGSYSYGTGAIAEDSGDLVFSSVAVDASGYPEFAITRLTADGQPDSSFGSGGTAYAQPNTGATPLSLPTGVVATPDGGYAVAGSVFSLSGATPTIAAVAVRFTSKGLLDSSFADGGVFTLPNSVQAESFASGILAQGDGKLLLVGIGADSSMPSPPEPIVARLNADGTLDSSFAGGLAASGVRGQSSAYGTAAAQTADGNLVLTGYGYDSSSQQSSFLQELNLDTAPTVTFTYAPASVQAGTPVQFSAAASPSAGESIGQISWDFGAGSLGAATGANVSHTFTAPGTYTVRVQATDAFGLSSIATQTITVAAAPVTTTTTPTVTPAIKKAPKLRLISIRASHGKIKVTLLCTGATCKVSSALTTLEHLISGRTASLSSGGHGKHTKTVRVAAARVTLQPGKAHTYTLKLNGTGRRLLATFHKIPATASFKLTNARPAKTIRHRVRIH